MKVVKRYDKRKKKHLKKYKQDSKYSNLIIWVVIVVLFLVAFLMYDNLLLPQIDLEGSKKIVLNYKDKYTEYGYEANFLGTDITDNVVVKGKVNPKKVGVYKITYSVESNGFTKKVVRKVYVKDEVAPKMNIDDKTLYLCPGEEIKASKVKATDNYDGDISDKVKVDISKEKITYKVKDSSGNSKKIVKYVEFKDKEKPNIELIGGDEITLYLGEKYSELGYKVVDNCDDKLNKKVKVEGKVNTDELGEYTLKYSVTDSSNNVSKISRKVIVKEKDDKGVIYLTFDDGPKEGVTDTILDILAEEGVKATFFVTKNGPDHLIKRAYGDGHTIALHTYTHNYATVYASVDDYFKDLDAVSDRVERITGEKSKIIRFPGGSSNTISRRYSPGIMTELTKEVINRGYRYYDWNISSGDAEIGVNDPLVVENNVTSNLSKDRVNMVLMHDIKSYTRDSLRRIIKYGKDNGYRFDKITMSTEMVTQRVNN